MAPKVALADITTTTFDTNAAGGNGFYNGNGNPDGHFATTTLYAGTDTISLSLRGKYWNYVGPIIPSGNDYVCLSSTPTPAGPGQCNFDFSVATTGAFHIGDFSYLLSVQDLTTSKSITFNPLLLDNSYWNGGKTSTYSAGASGFENSEYLGSGWLGLGGWQSTDRVVVSLSAVSGGHNAAAEIGFNTSVPEPGVVILLLTMLAPLGLLARRKNLS